MLSKNPTAAAVYAKSYDEPTDNQQGRLESENNTIKVVEDILSGAYAHNKKQFDDLFELASRRGPYPSVMEDMAAAKIRFQLVETIAGVFEESTGSKLTIGRDIEVDREPK